MNNDFENNIPEELQENDNLITEPIYEFPEGSEPQDDIPDEFPVFVDEKPKKKKKCNCTRIIALSLVAGIVFGIGFGFSSSIIRRYAMPNLNIPSTEVELSKSDEAPQQDSVSAIAEACMPSVVAITNHSVSDVITFFGRYSQESTSSGSGIIIGKNDTELLIVTNYHVVDNSKELSVIFSSVEKKIENQSDAEKLKGTDIPTAIVKGYEASKDLAVIAVKLEDIPADVLSEIKIATIGNSSLLKAGDQVIAIGNALGYGQSVTKGIISATNRKIAMKSVDGSTSVTNSFIQTDAAINAGNSGGALLDMNGNLIGINSAKISSTGVEGVGYAIPISDVEEIIDELMVRQTRDKVDSKKQGFLGITGADVTATENETYGMPVGVFVSDVTKGLAADKAGIKKGCVITEFDGYTVATIAQLQDRLTYYKEGEKVVVTAQVPSEDGYVEREFTVELSNRSKNIQE